MEKITWGLDRIQEVDVTKPRRGTCFSPADETDMSSTEPADNEMTNEAGSTAASPLAKPEAFDLEAAMAAQLALLEE